MAAQTDPSTGGSDNDRLQTHHNGTNGTSSPHKAATPTQVNGKSEEWTAEKGEDGNVSRVFIVSAKNADTTRSIAKNLASYLSNTIKKGEILSLTEVANTLSERQSRLGYTAAVRASNLVELVACLNRPQLKIHTSIERIRLGFVFNGQGAQWHAMGRELLTVYPVFASAVREADDILRGFGADWSLQDELMRDAESTRLSEIHISQPSTVALQLALVKLLRSWNIHPSAVVSHSTGEFAAAYTAGALSFPQALGIVYHFGDLVRKYHGLSGQAGDMAAAAMSAKDAEKYTTNTSAGGRVVVACINSPKSVTLSGDRDDLEEVMRRLDQDGIFARKLKVPLAYHSPHMSPLTAEYTERLRQFLPSQPAWTGDVVYASPVTGAVVDSPQVLTPEYYVRNITSPVLFSDAFSAISQRADQIVEIGPHSTLSGPIRDILESDGREMGYTTCLKRHVNAVHTMQDLACDLVGLGYSVSLRDVNLDTNNRNFLPDLPDYPFGDNPEALASGPSLTDPEVSRSKILWELDILHTIPSHIKDSMRITLTQDEVDTERTLVRASYFYMADALLQLQSEDQESWTAPQKEMVEWMVSAVALGKQGSLGPGSAMWSRASRGMKQMLYDELKQSHDVAGQVVARVGGNLADIVRDQVTPLELLTEGDLINKYYMELPSLKSRTYKHLSRATELFAIKTPGAKVLEIGGGTGGATRAVLDAFGSRAVDMAGTLLGHYVFTNKDTRLFGTARRNLKSWDNLVEFHELDIDADSIPQSNSFLPGTFDLIVSSMLFSTNRSQTSTLLHAIKLLKPGGKLFLVGPAEGSKLDVQLASRTLTLPERWSSKHESPLSPVPSINAWDTILRDTGFTGVEFEIPDNEHPQYKSSSFIISTATTTPALPSCISIVYTTPIPEPWHSQLTTTILNNTNISSITPESWDDFNPEDKTCIFTGDMPGPFLKDIPQASFTKLQQLLHTSSNILWLSHSSAADVKHPSYAHTHELLRAFRQETPNKRYIHLDFEQTSQGPWTSENIDHIVHVLQHTMDRNLEIPDVDWEYAVKNSMLHVPRIFPVHFVPDVTKVDVENLETILQPPVSPAKAQVIIGLPPFDKLEPGDPILRDRRFGTMRLGIRRAVKTLESPEITTTQTSTPSDLLVQALKNGSGEQAVALALQGRLAVLLHVQTEEIDLATPLALYGVDSIVAVDLRSWLATVGLAKLSVLEILNAVSLHEVARLVIARTQLVV